MYDVAGTILRIFDYHDPARSASGFFSTTFGVGFSDNNAQISRQPVIDYPESSSAGGSAGDLKLKFGGKRGRPRPMVRLGYEVRAGFGFARSAVELDEGTCGLREVFTLIMSFISLLLRLVKNDDVEEALLSSDDSGIIYAASHRVEFTRAYVISLDRRIPEDYQLDEYRGQSIPQWLDPGWGWGAIKQNQEDQYWGTREETTRMTEGGAARDLLVRVVCQ
ncbi:hypothetical protein SISNIDRAFT_469517 [Sistotremastrum niveocremeum HHB9708]|uniref:Uncharacterized protein n=1 Tax=Sistotremastrum niveocremeum HHB9708 TaxID=1314777 RepID=A0A164Q1P6_9AGAM|nr:hypothetical protein SISNIDRAFT_469517 [Sistotremastrum niveocremeum HHB9708]